MHNTLNYTACSDNSDIYILHHTENMYTTDESIQSINISIYSAQLTSVVLVLVHTLHIRKALIG